MLTRAVRDYLRVRRAIGYDLRENERALLSFCRFATRRGETHVTARSAVEWSARASSVRQRDRVLKTIILFARHVRAEDPRHEVPRPDTFGPPPRPRRPTPFIFTPKEISSVVAEAGRLGPAGSLRPRTLQTLFALLAATGLRISEALELRLGDITADGLLIRGTKFRKSRLVPLHETVSAGIDRYLRHRLRVGTRDDHLFVSLRRRKLCYLSVFYPLKEIVGRLGLSDCRAAKRKPRIHDFRHTFAVRALEASRGDRDRIGKHMVALSTYMGHVGIEETYWYLQATPELMAGIAAANERLLNGGTA
jgi:integrase/recombinase XerD